MAGQLGYFRDAFIDYNRVLLPYYRYRLDPVGREVGCTRDLRRMAADPLASTVLASAYLDQRNFGRFRQEERQAVEAVRDRLACLLERPECGPAGAVRPRRRA